MTQSKAKQMSKSMAFILSAPKNFGAMRIGLNLWRDFQMNRDSASLRDSMTTMDSHLRGARGSGTNHLSKEGKRK